VKCAIRLAAGAAFFLSSSGFAAEVSGQPRIVDGDTVQIGQTKIRFAGIDAPETDQVCLDGRGQRWACGVTARDELVRYSAGREWECDLTGTDRYDRSLGKCFVEGEDVSAWMVRSGWALSFVRYSHEYDREEAAARNQTHPDVRQRPQTRGMTVLGRTLKLLRSRRRLRAHQRLQRLRPASRSQRREKDFRH
jgi:endonuclease YncB( thermonuclease family)